MAQSKMLLDSENAVWRNDKMSILKLDKVTKRFGGLVAVDNVSMEIQQGEILVVALEEEGGPRP